MSVSALQTKNRREASAFAERMPLEDAWRWLDGLPFEPVCELIPVEHACGRVLAAPLVAPEDRPAQDVILEDGYAVRAADTTGASAYNPLFLRIAAAGKPLAAGCAAPCNAGEEAPSGVDTVLPPEVVQAAGAILEVSEPVAPGQGIGRRGQTAQQGQVVIAEGRQLGARDIAVADLLGIREFTVLRQPRVTVVLASAKLMGREALAKALAAVIARDSGIARVLNAGAGDLPQTLGGVADADVVLVVGQSGKGADDRAREAVEAAQGHLIQHGIAVSPGDTAGFGTLDRAALLLLPGDPLAALITYDLLSSRLVRRMAARPVCLPYDKQSFILTRKISSAIGLVEWVPVRCVGKTASPLPVSRCDGLIGAMQADGFILVPAGLEGYASRHTVDVCLFASPPPMHGGGFAT